MNILSLSLAHSQELLPSKTKRNTREAFIFNFHSIHYFEIFKNENTTKAQILMFLKCSKNDN